MPHVIAVANQKGGSAKTTTAVHLAATLGERGVPVLLVDLDPQASASRWLGAPGEGQVLLDLLTGDGAQSLAAAAGPSTAAGVDLVPASPVLVHAERDLVSQPGGVLALARLLDELPERWRYVVLDCPPHLGQLTASALLAASVLLVPVEASPMAMAGLARLLETTRGAARNNPRLCHSAILCCRIDYRNRISRAVVETLRERFPAATLDTVIRERVALREAWSHRQPLTVYAPGNDATADYRALAGEILARTEAADDAA